jgi:hypothetical protein
MKELREKNNCKSLMDVQTMLLNTYYKVNGDAKTLAIHDIEDIIERHKTALGKMHFWALAFLDVLECDTEAQAYLTLENVIKKVRTAAKVEVDLPVNTEKKTKDPSEIAGSP